MCAQNTFNSYHWWRCVLRDMGAVWLPRRLPQAAKYVIAYCHIISYIYRVSPANHRVRCLEQSTARSKHTPYTDSLVINRSIKIRGGDSMWASMCNQVIAQLRATKRY
jgi:hypothetical protein